MKFAKISEALFKAKSGFRHQAVPERKTVEDFLETFLDLAFPGLLRKNYSSEIEFASAFLAHVTSLKKLSDKLADEYPAQIPKLSEAITKDATALLNGDPAASSIEEILLCYPGLYAVATYRLAHFFWQKEIKFVPRMLSEIAHEKTGIDIHPGASIGESFFIDHGTGVVIGETAKIGNGVKLYQGVTLGALSVNKTLAQTKRHPTIEDGCVIYSHATILGGDTIIGKDSIIGGNVWITKSVPANSLVYHKSEVKLDRVDSTNPSVESFTQEDELTYEI